jgi:alpha-beta hydrolase superfamily lysophospholipase
MKTYSHNTGTFIGKGGTEIFFQNWIVDKPRGILVIAHGVGEHSGRYDNIINELKGSGISVYALDHRGHGKSGGKRGHVDSFMDYVYDLKLFIDLIREENRSVHLVLLGHSMGGAIACRYALTYSDDMDALILSSPGLIFGGDAPAWKKKMAVILSKYLPSITMATGLATKDLSHDRAVIDAYENDPLVHDRMSPRLFTEFVNNGVECLERASELSIPLLVFHGKEDRIVDYHGSEQVYQKASSSNKVMHIYEGLFHETMNETDKKKVLKMVAQWIVKAISGKKKQKTLKKSVKKNR